MAVFRVEKTKDFTIMSNHHLRNTELSLKAKGLLSLMLSLPEIFRIGGNMRLDSLTFCRRCDRSGWFCTARHI